MNKGQLRNVISFGLFFLILGSAHAFKTDNPIIASDISTIKVDIIGGNGTLIGSCRKSLQGCTGIIICPNCSGTPPSSQTLTITNTSTSNANNIVATGAESGFNTFVSQVNTCSPSLPANQSCTITFSTTATLPAYPGFTTTLIVSGSNVSPSVTVPFQYLVNG